MNQYAPLRRTADMAVLKSQPTVEEPGVPEGSLVVAGVLTERPVPAPPIGEMQPGRRYKVRYARPNKQGEYDIIEGVVRDSSTLVLDDGSIRDPANAVEAELLDSLVTPTKRGRTERGAE